MRDAAPIVPGRRRSRLPTSVVGFFHGTFQPHLDQMQHAPIHDPARHRLEKVGMRNAPEVVREVGVDDFLAEWLKDRGMAHVRGARRSL